MCDLNNNMLSQLMKMIAIYIYEYIRSCYYTNIRILSQDQISGFRRHETYLKLYELSGFKRYESMYKTRKGDC